MLQRKQPDKSPKALALMVSLLLLLCVTVSGTASFLLDNAGSIENIFKSSRVTTSVTETLTNGVKSNVKITNTGDTDAYIRAAVVATWRDAEGNLYGKACHRKKTGGGCKKGKCGGYLPRRDRKRKRSDPLRAWD